MKRPVTVRQRAVYVHVALERVSVDDSRVAAKTQRVVVVVFMIILMMMMMMMMMFVVSSFSSSVEEFEQRLPDERFVVQIVVFYFDGVHY